MSEVEIRWEKRQCRVENGLFFPDDTVARVEGCPESGYTVHPAVPLSQLISPDPTGWVDLEATLDLPLPRFSLRVLAGEGSWEAEGFVAALDRASGRLLWILHLDNSEAFSTLSESDGVILATAIEYPFRNVFSIPPQGPARFTVSCTHEP